MRSIIIIPARLESTRLPRKLLLDATGKSVLQHTYEAASRAEKPSEVWVATDSQQIVDLVESFGGRVRLTDPDARTGTDRVAELAHRLASSTAEPGVETDRPFDLVVNVQGDEPEISPQAIDLAVELLERDSEAVMSTLATPIRAFEQLQDPACVKVVCDHVGRALYFSRSTIPYPRDWREDLLYQLCPAFLQHIGLYAYRADFLQQVASLPESVLEQVECLEQLRVLAAGYAIKVGVVDEASIGIDTPADYRAFVERHKARKIDEQ